MANYRRKRPKSFNVSTCGARNCKYDKTAYHGNGAWRHTSSYWRKLGGRKARRYDDIGTIYYHG